MATTDELLGNVVQLLCAARAYFPFGGCNAQTQNARTQAQLQAQLVIAFPANGWGNPAQLTNILQYGQTYGALICAGTMPQSYMIRLDMVRLNPRFDAYRVFCSALYPPTIDAPPNGLPCCP